MFVLRPNEDFYKQFGSVMLRRYSNVSGSLPETAAEAFAAGIKPTFQQFITYLLDPETERESIFNEHWRQVFVSHGTVRLRLIQFGKMYEMNGFCEITRCILSPSVGHMPLLHLFFKDHTSIISTYCHYLRFIVIHCHSHFVCVPSVYYIQQYFSGVYFYLCTNVDIALFGQLIYNKLMYHFVLMRKDIGMTLEHDNISI